MNKLYIVLLTLVTAGNGLFAGQYTAAQLQRMREQQQREEATAQQLRETTQARQDARIAKQQELLAQVGNQKQEVANQIAKEKVIAQNQDNAAQQPLTAANTTDAVVAAADAGLVQKMQDAIAAHPNVLKGAAALAVGFAAYTFKDKIVAFAKKHPYVAGSLVAATTGLVGASLYTGLPLTTCAVAGLKFAYYGPLMASDFVARLQLLAMSWNAAKNRMLPEKIITADNTTNKEEDSTIKS